MQRCWVASYGRAGREEVPVQMEAMGWDGAWEGHAENGVEALGFFDGSLRVGELDSRGICCRVGVASFIGNPFLYVCVGCGHGYYRGERRGHSLVPSPKVGDGHPAEICLIERGLLLM